MAKKLREIAEVYDPKAKDEKKFKDKHVVSKTDDANGNKDDVFQATNVKTVDRYKEAHGYNPGQDEKVYEEVDQLDEITHEGAVRASSTWRAKGDLKRAQLYMKLAKALEMKDMSTAAGIEQQIRGISEESVEEKLKPSMGAGKYISDFEKSSAPQFKGKSKEKRRVMGIAAYLSAKKGMKEEVEQMDEEIDVSLLELYINLSEDNRQSMLQMIDEGRHSELYEFAEVLNGNDN